MKLGKRAISPLIATIILISICVAGGLLIYNVFFSTTGTLTAKGQVSVESIDLVKATGGDVAFSITIKNTGNKPAKSVKITLVGGDNKINDVGLLGTGSSLEPGQTVSYFNTEL